MSAARPAKSMPDHSDHNRRPRTGEQANGLAGQGSDHDERLVHSKSREMEAAEGSAAGPPASRPSRHASSTGSDASSLSETVSHDRRPTPPVPLRQVSTTPSSRPYSAFPRHSKYLIVLIGAFTCLFSPISSNIFVPAIPTLAAAFHRTEEEINLAVTVYLVFQAITPSFFGALSDSIGRRPVYIIVLVIYLAANIGLALVPATQSGYAGLLVLRCLQATGGSAVVSVGAGAISDVAEPRERGMYMGLFQLGAMVGPAFGPFLGGVFTETLGWRAIFWFLAIASGIALLAVVFFFPETLRALVGDGSIPPPMLNSSPQMCLKRRKMEHEMKARGEEGEEVVRPEKKKFQVLSAFTLLITTPEMTLSLLFTSLLYLVFYSILSLYSTALTNAYHFNELIIGLCYLPSGIGSVIAALVNGRQLDYFYRKEEARAGGDYRKKGEEFRLEAARLRCIFPFAALSFVCSISLGWCLQARAPLAATLVVNFFMGLSLGTTNIVTVYGQDLRPGQGGAVSASNNLVRCLFGAVGTAVIQILYRAIGAGWTMVLIAGIALCGLPFLLVAMKYGRSWRIARAEKAENLNSKSRRSHSSHKMGLTALRGRVDKGVWGMRKRGRGSAASDSVHEDEGLERERHDEPFNEAGTVVAPGEEAGGSEGLKRTGPAGK